MSKLFTALKKAGKHKLPRSGATKHGSNRRSDKGHKNQPLVCDVLARKRLLENEARLARKAR